jgi:hypothetical protein
MKLSVQKLLIATVQSYELQSEHVRVTESDN